MKARTLTSGTLAAIGATALLAGAALATTTTASVDADPGSPTPPGAAISKLARTTAAVGEAKGDLISAAASADRDRDAADADTHGDTVSALAHKTAPGPEHGETVSAAASANGSSASAPGAVISQLATTSSATGEAKGDAISAAARTNRSTR